MYLDIDPSIWCLCKNAMKVLYKLYLDFGDFKDKQVVSIGIRKKKGIGTKVMGLNRSAF